MTDSSFIYLHRKITEWEWYQNTNTFRVFIHCLLKANYKDKQWQGITIKRGQFVTSQYRLADELGLSRTAVKRAIDDLKMTKELTYSTNYRNTIITVVNYDEYQKHEPLKDIKKAELIKKEHVLHDSTTIHTHYKENVCENFSENEIRILKDYARKSNARNVDAYVNALIKKGGAEEIIAEYRNRQKQKNEQLTPSEKSEILAAETEKENAAFFEKFKTKEQAISYLKKNCHNFINPIQKELMKKFEITVDEVKNV